MEGQEVIGEFTSGLEAIPDHNAFKKPGEPGSQVRPVGNKTPQKTSENTGQDDAYLEDCDNSYTVVFARYGHNLTFWHIFGKYFVACIHINSQQSNIMYHPYQSFDSTHKPSVQALSCSEISKTRFYKLPAARFYNPKYFLFF